VSGGDFGRVLVAKMNPKREQELLAMIEQKDRALELLDQ